MKILMSRDNPDGYPLEQLLSDMIDDLAEKQAGIVKTMGLDEPPTDHALAEMFGKPGTGVTAVIYCSNRRALRGLQDALEAQTFTLRALDTLGKDQGPRGTPRV